MYAQRYSTLLSTLSKRTSVILVAHLHSCAQRLTPSIVRRTLLYQSIRGQKTESKGTKLVKKSADEKKFSELTLGEKVVRTSKDATYTGIVIVGIGVTAVMFYMIGRELLSKQSPSGVYGQALKHLKKNDQVYAIFGSPLKGYGERNRRGRRRHVSHADWMDDYGRKHMRMKFYIEGPSEKGTVHLEVKENEKRKFEYRYMFVEVENSRRQIVVEDHR